MEWIHKTIDVGARVVQLTREEHPAYVTEMTPRGFKFNYEQPISLIAREGSWVTGGETYHPEDWQRISWL